ncbi:MAG: hypothetical protein II981_10685 [Bacteroidales bacterium]|nr:hypothetical protein [Bacteroidales bacterium]
MNAERHFKELESILKHDSAMLWGINMYGPTMFVDPESRMIVANRQDKNGLLKKNGNVYLGFLPDEYNIANTALTFSDELWTCVSRMDFDNDIERNLLLVHESWHRVQNEIGVLSVMSNNTHLENVEAAILLKMEMIALNHALMNDADNNDLVNTLTIRMIRQEKYPNNNEDEYECHEGLAEYTALKVLANDDKNYILMKAILLNIIENALGYDTYTHSFAYVTGPAYGFILDEISSNWKNDVMSGSTMNDILLNIVDINTDIDKDAFISNLVECYNIEVFINNEYERLTSLKQDANIMRRKFDASPSLYIKNNGVNFTYNPNERVIPYDNLGNIYGDFYKFPV